MGKHILKIIFSLFAILKNVLKGIYVLTIEYPIHSIKIYLIFCAKFPLDTLNNTYIYIYRVSLE